MFFFFLKNNDIQIPDPSQFLFPFLKPVESSFCPQSFGIHNDEPWGGSIIICWAGHSVASLWNLMSTSHGKIPQKIELIIAPHFYSLFQHLPFSIIEPPRLNPQFSYVFSAVGSVALLCLLSSILSFFHSVLFYFCYHDFTSKCSFYSLEVPFYSILFLFNGSNIFFIPWRILIMSYFVFQVFSLHSLFAQVAFFFLLFSFYLPCWMLSLNVR